MEIYDFYILLAFVIAGILSLFGFAYMYHKGHERKSGILLGTGLILLYFVIFNLLPFKIGVHWLVDTVLGWTPIIIAYAIAFIATRFFKYIDRKKENLK